MVVSCDDRASMRRIITAVFVMMVVSIVAWQLDDSASADGPSVLVVEIDGDIEPLTADRIARGIDEARDTGATLAVIRLDTPGGLLDSTREIVEDILASEIPVAVYVGPAGARAASAGTFVAAAANFAVMAPGTNIGAATPVKADGGDIPETLSRKISADTSAFIRSIAQARGRNAEALEKTVLQATAYSAEEALDLGVIDLIAPDMTSMLDQLDGRTTTTSTGQVTVSTDGASVRELDRTFMEYALGILASPNVVFALFLIGGIALLVEFVMPGLFGPASWELSYSRWRSSGSSICRAAGSASLSSPFRWGFSTVRPQRRDSVSSAREASCVSSWERSSCSGTSSALRTCRNPASW